MILCIEKKRKVWIEHVSNLYDASHDYSLLVSEDDMDCGSKMLRWEVRRQFKVFGREKQ